MLNKLGRFTEVTSDNYIDIDLKTLKPGVNNLKNHLIKLNDDSSINYVIDKVCNHAGGRLILKKDKAVCPLHGWELNLENRLYNNSHIPKETIPYKQTQPQQITINDPVKHLLNPFYDPNKKGKVSLRWLNHATVYIECNGVSLITDPWLFGPSFMTGWWLYEPSTTDAIDLLKKADFVYISHNHPDHLHPETLALLSKNTTFITGKFNSESCKKYLQSLGFNQVFDLGFHDLYEIVPGFQIGILKSGDFRDDSGIYFNANNNEILLTVDCNFLNSNILPKHIDLLMTSFAGGASGFPLCFDNYTLEEKEQVVLRNKFSIRTSVVSYLKSTLPKYYMPYAGMFKEYAQRDQFIKTKNVKNSPEDYIEIAQNFNAEYLSPEKDKVLNFNQGKLTINSVPDVSYLDKEDPEYYIKAYKSDYIYTPEMVIDYLKHSGFKGNQILQIIPTNDTFNQITNTIVYADFKTQTFKTITETELVDAKEGLRVMKMYIREEIMACVIENKLPWEDFSIGFQMRVKRSPNEYESDFWYHFTNVYINETNFRYTPYCGSCSIINQNPIWNKKLAKL